jgi:hypothetical protein
MRITYSLFCLLFISCSLNIKPTDLEHLNGYWRIDKAVAPSGEEKQYKSTIDIEFFKIEGQNGIKKKLKPLLNKQFNSTDDFVPFNIAFSQKKCIITYTKQKESWQEEITVLTAEKLNLKDARGVIFHYVKYLP